MTLCRLTLPVLAAIGLTVTVQSGIAQVPGLDMNAAYAATRIIESGGERLEQRYYQQSATISRMETRVRGEASVVILRGDRNVMWTVMPSQRMYMEMALDAGGHAAELAEIPDQASWTSIEELGREDVGGVPATRYRVRSDDADGGRTTGMLWVADNGIPVRMHFDGADGAARMELRDLVPGAQPAALFEPPAGYQRVAIGGGGGPSSDGREPGFLDDLADGAADEAKRTTNREVRREVRENVSRGLRGLLGRP